VLFLSQPEGELSFVSNSGGSIEQFYDRYGATTAHYLPTNPAERLTAAIDQGFKLSIIHISGALRETSGGIFLDFEDTRDRGATYRGANTNTLRRTRDLEFDVSGLHHRLQTLMWPPFIVLDVPYAFNVTEAIRMLLLRNRFATQLFELGFVRGILGCGLGPPEDAFELNRNIVMGLMTQSVSATLRDLRRRPVGDGDPFNQALSITGAALWTNNPDDQLFIAGPAA
jgi:cellulose synthase operon protein C